MEVFNVTTAGVSPAMLLVPILGAVFICIGVAHIRGKIFPDVQRSLPWFGPVFLTFSLLWTFGVSGALLWSNFSARRALRAGEVRTVKGLVQDFHAMPPGGHANETFVVRGIRFSYSEYTLAPGFHQTRSQGGPIVGGEYVRIVHRDGTILRLEKCGRIE